MLATVKHETADTFQPIEERGGYNYFKYLIGKLGIRTLRSKQIQREGLYTNYRVKNYEKFSLIMNIDFVSVLLWLLLKKTHTIL